MLLGAEGRGLPGARIERIKLQRGDEGHPLDDIAVVGRDRLGQQVGVDIQVKRTIAFSPGDEVFQKVLGQVATTLRQPAGPAAGSRLAVATSQTSRKIAGAYQDILTWARRIGDAPTFMDRLKRPGSANPDMRAFVDTIRARLVAESLPASDEDVWALLRRLHILVFDFSTDDSASDVLAREQCVRALASEQADRAALLWTSLIELALATAAAGGDTDRAGLVAHLLGQGFQLAGEARHEAARAALAEGAEHALADIDDTIGGAVLLRPDRIEAVQGALEKGRYLEIRGAGGVGKSSILKAFAVQIAERSRLIVLTPERTPGGGWLALRDQLGFTGTARDLLGELAASGGGALLIDGLDNFQGPALRTVADLARTAAEVAGFLVVATLRLDADKDGLVPIDAIATLGRAPPMIIEELNEAEAVELIHAVPAVGPLLADGHPARAVARNLYRLKRLLRLDSAENVHTEVDLAQLWWDNADGEPHGLRDRRRLLTALADQVLAGASDYDVSAFAPEPIEALVASGTLRDLGADRAVFQHDVLRDWAVFNCLRQQTAAVGTLPLSRLAPVALMRGVELLARQRLEQAVDAAEWKALVDQLSVAGANPSWRRNAILAVARSETGEDQLTKAEPLLVADDGLLLGELIRAVSAVDVQTLDELSKVIAAPLEDSLRQFSVPRGPSWGRLIVWLLGLESPLPAKTLSAVLNLFGVWLISTGGRTWASEAIIKRLYGWLTEIEAGPDWSPALPASMAGTIDREEMARVTEMVRRLFVGMAKVAPDLARAYLEGLRKGGLDRHRVQDIVTQPGGLAFGAPQALADLTALALINAGTEDDDNDGGVPWNRPYTMLDSQFIPESPAQGPFLSLLQADPAVGIGLLRRLFDHAMVYYGRAADAESIILAPGTPDTRVIVWPETYAVARPGNNLGYGLTSGLMALEYWGHQRIEADAPVSEVIATVLGASPTPSPFVLVAVDLLLSHWRSDLLETAIPFVSSPELLCMDRDRHARDGLTLPDMSALIGLPQIEPGKGAMTAEALADRPSRRVDLDDLLGFYAIGEPAPRERLAKLLQAEAKRLGPVSAEMNFASPAFMAAHALNRIDLANYTKVQLGETPEQFAWRYDPPAAETDHLAALQAEQGPLEAHLAVGLGEAIEADTDLTEAVWSRAREVVGRADKLVPGSDLDPSTGRLMQVHAAVLVARYATDEQWSKLGANSEALLGQALKALDDPEYRGQASVRFDMAGLGFTGLVYARLRTGGGDVRPLLEAATAPSGAAHRGAAFVDEFIAKARPGLDRALLRLAFGRAVWETRLRTYDDAVEAALRDRRAEAGTARIEAELAWLDGGPEPAWPQFPGRTAALADARAMKALENVKRGIKNEIDSWKDPFDVIPAGVDKEAAGAWLNVIIDAAPIDAWRLDVLERYSAWTLEELAARGKAANLATSRWMEAYFGALGAAAAAMSPVQRQTLIVDAFAALKPEDLLSLAGGFLRRLDEAFFNTIDADPDVVVAARKAVFEAVRKTPAWTRMAGSFSNQVETGLSNAVAGLLFNARNLGEPARTYLTDIGVGRIDPFLPLMVEIASAGPSVISAQAFLSVLEQAPRVGFTGPVLTTAEAWMTAFPGHAGFWAEHGVGKRVTVLLETLSTLEPAVFVVERARLETLLAQLVAVGVPEAARLEARLFHG